MIGAILEVLLNLLVEFVVQFVVEGLLEVGWESVRRVSAKRGRVNRAAAAAVLVLLGGVTGYLSVLFVPVHLFGPSRYPGISLLVAPLATGAALQALGSWRAERGHTPSVLATFWGGALFAFAMVGVRVLLV